MTFLQVRNGPSEAIESALSRTLAYGTGTRNWQLIMTLGLVACVINGESATSLIAQTTWLIIVITIFVIVNTISMCATQRTRGRSI